MRDLACHDNASFGKNRGMEGLTRHGLANLYENEIKTIGHERSRGPIKTARHPSARASQPQEDVYILLQPIMYLVYRLTDHLPFNLLTIHGSKLLCFNRGKTNGSN
jgi:hypothetical protein